MSDAPGPMNGAESLVHTLAASGVDVCFTNPGTSEMHFVAALDRIPGVRCVLGLFEGVVTGAADGYWRMAHRPAATLLHLGPGLGNGLANLHNAGKALSGIVNVVGDHATEHSRFESPLKSRAADIAGAVSSWVRACQRAEDVGLDAAAAVQATRDGAVGRIATLLLPADTAWGVGGRPAMAAPAVAAPAPMDAVPAAARALRERGAKALLLLGAGGSADPKAQALGAAIAAKTGCKLMTEFYNARQAGGRGRHRVERLPYPVDLAAERLAPYDTLVLAGAVEPIGFFAYPNKPSQLKAPGAMLMTLATPQQDVRAILSALAEELGAAPVAVPEHALRAAPSGALTPETIAAAVAATLPEQCIVIDEGVSTGRGMAPALAGAPPHDVLAIMGGAIGWGLPGAVGAAIGAPGRPVLALEGDGSAMYTVQALWTMAREQLPVTVLVFANRAYRILQGELQGVGATISGNKARDMLSLDRPALDWVSIARGHGLGAVRVDSAEALVQALRDGHASRAPNLIEAVF